MSTSASSVCGAPGATQRRGGDRSSRGTKIGGTRLHVTRRGDREYRAGREYVRLNTNSTRIVSKAPAATRGRDSDSTATRRPSRGGIRRPFRPPLSPLPLVPPPLPYEYSPTRDFTRPSIPREPSSRRAALRVRPSLPLFSSRRGFALAFPNELRLCARGGGAFLRLGRSEFVVVVHPNG